VPSGGADGPACGQRMPAERLLGAGRPGALPKRLVLGLIRGYQLLFSPLFAGSCRYVPSCSAYAREAVARFGVLRGGWLALKRLGRCHPFGGHGFDPVVARPARRLPAGDDLRPHEF